MHLNERTTTRLEGGLQMIAKGGFVKEMAEWSSAVIKTDKVNTRTHLGWTFPCAERTKSNLKEQTIRAKMQ